MKVKEVFNDGNYQVLIENIQELDFEQRTFSHHYYYIKSLNRVSKIDKSIKYAESVLENTEEQVDMNYLRIIYELIWAYHKKGNLEPAIDHLDNALNVIDTRINCELESDKRQIVNAIINLGGIIHYSLGNLDEALRYFKQLINDNNEIDNDKILQGGKINLGLISLDRGEYTKSIEYLQDALSSAETNHHNEHVRVAASNLAYIFMTIGDLRKAESFAIKAINAAGNTDNTWGLAIIYNTMGLIKQKKGDFEAALKHLDESYKIMKEFDNAEYISRIQFYKNLIHLNLGNRFDANEALQEIKSYAKKTDNSRVQLIYQISEAIYLRYSNLYRHKLEAEERLKEILNSEFKIESELISYVYLFLTELLLEQLSKIQHDSTDDYSELLDEEQSVIDEVEQLSNKILEIANQQQSPELKLQVHFIKAHLSILRMDSENLSLHLKEAEQISEKWGLSEVTISEPTFDEFDISNNNPEVLQNLPTSINDKIHSFPRLKIMIVLSQESKMTFTELQNYVDLSSGNLSNHCNILIENGYMIKSKEIVENKFQTLYSMTNYGLKALNNYKDQVRLMLLTNKY